MALTATPLSFFFCARVFAAGDAVVPVLHRRLRGDAQPGERRLCRHGTAGKGGHGETRLLPCSFEGGVDLGQASDKIIAIHLIVNSSLTPIWEVAVKP